MLYSLVIYLFLRPLLLCFWWCSARGVTSEQLQNTASSGAFLTSLAHSQMNGLIFDPTGNKQYYTQWYLWVWRSETLRRGGSDRLSSPVLWCSAPTGNRCTATKTLTQFTHVCTGSSRRTSGGSWLLCSGSGTNLCPFPWLGKDTTSVSTSLCVFNSLYVKTRDWI